MILALMLAVLVITDAPSWSQQPGDSPQIRAGFEALRRGDVDGAIAEAESEIRRRPSAGAQELLGAALIQKRQWDRAEEALKRAKQLDPKRLGAFLGLGQLLLHANRLAEAEENFKAALALSPHESAAVRGRAGVALRRGDFGQAIAMLEDGLKQSGGRDDAVKTLLATLYYELGHLQSVERIVGQPCAGSAGCLLLGLTRLEQGRRGDALTLLDSSANEHGDSSWPIVARGVALRLRGQPRQGLGELEQAAKRQPDWPFIPRELGETWLAEGDVPRALASFEEGIRIALDPVMTRVRIARSLLANAQREQAVRVLERAKGESPRSSDSVLALGGMYRRLHQTGKAESLLRQAAMQFPKDARVPHELGMILIGEKRDEEAVAPLTTAASLAPKWPEPVMRLAEVQARRGQRQQALATAERAVKLIGEGPVATLFVGSVHEQLRDLRAAEAAYRKALKQDSNFVPAELSLAALAERQGKPDEARAILERAAARTSSGLPSLQLALLHEHQGREGEAIAAYRVVIDRDPQNLLALNNLAWLLGKQPGQLKDAIALAERAYQGAPESAAACDTLGWLLAEAGELGRGVALLRRAVALEPDDPSSRYRFGVVLAKRGDRTEAIAELRLALASRPFPEAEAARRTLETLERN